MKVELAMVMAAGVLLAMVLTVSAAEFDIADVPVVATPASLGVVDEYRVVLATALVQTDAEEAVAGLYRYDQVVGGGILYLYYTSMDRAASVARLINITDIDISGFDSIELSTDDLRWVEKQTQEYFARG